LQNSPAFEQRFDRYSMSAATVEVDLAPIGIQAVDELAASLNQSPEACTVMLCACHVTLRYEATILPPSKVAFAI
jgi:hypothetical protein